VNRKVLSGLRTGPIWFWIAFSTGIAAYVLRADIGGEGIKTTLLFKSMGILAFPVFYGCVIVAVVLFVRMFSFKKEWLTISGAVITVGNRQIPLEAVRDVEVRRNWIGLRELVFHRADGPDFATKAYLLSRPVAEVLAEMKNCLEQEGLRLAR
jgi:hypothetical protein